MVSTKYVYLAIINLQLNMLNINKEDLCEISLKKKKKKKKNTFENYYLRKGTQKGKGGGGGKG